MKKENLKNTGMVELLKLRRELSTKVAISAGKEYKETLQQLFDVKEEIERRKKL